MQDNPAAKKRDYSGRVYKPRVCPDCGGVFIPGSSGQKRCPGCQRERRRDLRAERGRNERDTCLVDGCGAKLREDNKTGYCGAHKCVGRVYRSRKCEDCPLVFTPASGKQKRCPDCQDQRNLAMGRERDRRSDAANRKPRYCDTCGTELPPYPGMHSRYCATCRPEARKAVRRAYGRQRVLSGEHSRYQHRYRRENREAVLARERRYKRDHPEYDQAALHRRRMRVEAGKLDAVDRMLSRFYRRAIKGDSCYYCGSPVTDHVDHYFALAKGGSDRWFNLVRACRKCNLRKRTRCGTAFLLLTGG